MNRLQSEVHRLYLSQPPGGQVAGAEAPDLIDADGRVRAMVLTLGKPADWAALSTVWRGVQVDLDLPAPAIAVAGQGGYQLWFSLASPLPVAQAVAFLDALRLRYLRDIAPHRIGMMPALDAASPGPARHAAMVPALQADNGHWSAFVAPDLAPVFGDEPWLDLPPSLDGQAGLLSRLHSIQAAELERAQAQLGTVGRPAGPAPPSPEPDATDAADAAAAPVGNPVAAGGELDPRSFLLRVMRDDSVALPLRIEAAKALLPCFDERRRSGRTRRRGPR